MPTHVGVRRRAQSRQPATSLQLDEPSRRDTIGADVAPNTFTCIRYMTLKLDLRSNPETACRTTRGGLRRKRYRDADSRSKKDPPPTMDRPPPSRSRKGTAISAEMIATRLGVW